MIIGRNVNYDTWNIFLSVSYRKNGKFSRLCVVISGIWLMFAYHKHHQKGMMMIWILSGIQYVSPSGQCLLWLYTDFIFYRGLYKMCDLCICYCSFFLFSWLFQRRPDLFLSSSVQAYMCKVTVLSSQEKRWYNVWEAGFFFFFLLIIFAFVGAF